ncbi:IclR family transcriptional regulator [Aeromicrobium sp. YIM 150415]|uniref:Glycerol operon regulatory protein n=1 Tax=Aeromicrobium piscarium TaxID=2590901 RepID=A0A554SGM5_9ACTN|nr:MULTISPECIES: IclR family transcriptional regulator [Aeromicrobium]MBM9462846.1 IclR family transcriptional regulator [Aeromicrobium sp. YIM 150415]TSD65505.1 IclR family transcriptional regulator [Aeromicrobium piscarium]
MKHSSEPVLLVTRTLDILEALARSGAPTALTELSEQVASPKATTHRILASLQARGYVSQDASTGRYSAGVRCFELGSLWAQNLDLRAVTAPYLKALNEQSRETVHLGVYEHGDVIYIDRLESPQQVVAKSYVGRRCPATCVATGRVLLAYSDHDEIDRVLSEPLPAYTDRSITDPAELGEMLTDVRERGYGINQCSYRDDVSGIAAPIRDHTGRVVASVGLCMPDHRMSPDRMDALRDMTLATAADISRALGDRRYFSTQLTTVGGES